MKQLNVSVADKIATFQDVDEQIVGFNGDYEIKFTFDEEWAAHPKKTARFVWNGMHHDVEFTGDTCAVPIIKDASCFSVGVYVGEEADGEDVLSTTKAIIPLMPSVRCGDTTPQPSSGEGYTNEAKGAAIAAAASAAEAKEAEENVKKAEPRIAHNSMRIEKIEDKLGLDGDMVKIVGGYYTSGSSIRESMYKYVRVLRLGAANGVASYNEEYHEYIYYSGSFPEINGQRFRCLTGLPGLGVGNHDNERYANYIFFEGGKAYYHQGCRLSDYDDTAEGEIALEKYAASIDVYIIGLAEPIITDITDKVTLNGEVFNGVLELDVTDNEETGDDYGVYGYGELLFNGDGFIEIAYMTKEEA